MIIEIKIPSAGESVTEAALGTWLAENGAMVEQDQEIAEVESDKATLPLIAPQRGTLKILVAAGQHVKVGDVACIIDTSSITGNDLQTVKKDEVTDTVKINPPEKAEIVLSEKPENKKIKVTPVAKHMMDQHHIDIEGIISGLKRITTQEVEAVLNKSTANQPGPVEFPGAAGRPVDKAPMSPLRRKLGKRLVAVKNETAMLTTFNEIDMSSMMELRKKYQEAFQLKHGQKLGLMSFFTKASAEALLLFPKVNSMIEQETILTPQFVDIAIAVQTDKGLMVPVIRNVHLMNLALIELSVAELAAKARIARLTIEEMTGGTFTITNGGVFGSMLSTPIINPPQSAILGMHNIVDRPVAVNGRIEIRPMMYVALSYDHRLIDGRDSVSFLVKIKELIESPLKMVISGNDPEKILLDL
jgi:2-oxoglutarate dehydrogenase E2 component (dihydrolipoamide succinyltransferase)